MTAHAKDSPVTTRQTARSLPQPATTMGRRIVTLLDWTGALQLGDIADALSEPDTSVWDWVKALEDEGYLTPSSQAGMPGWISTHAWRPNAKGTVPGVHAPGWRPGWRSGEEELNP